MTTDARSRRPDRGATVPGRDASARSDRQVNAGTTDWCEVAVERPDTSRVCAGAGVVRYRQLPRPARPSAPPLGWFGTDRGNDEVEAAAVAESHCAEIPDVARREPGHPELLGERNDAGFDEPQLERGVGCIDVERTRQ